MLQPVLHDGWFGLDATTELLIGIGLIMVLLGLAVALWRQRRGRQLALLQVERERVAREHAERLAAEAVRLRRQEEALAGGADLRTARRTLQEQAEAGPPPGPDPSPAATEDRLDRRDPG